jgi:cytochrome d ubiquinol oxidase subunit I
MLLSGDWAASFLARHEQPKLAAAEALFHTTRGAPLIIGGWPDPEAREVRFAVEIPKLLSVLAFRDPDAEVAGLDAFPPETVPDPRLVHPFFALMVGSFFLMAAAAGWFWWGRWRRRGAPEGRWLLRAILVASPFGMIALESGWLVTEFGRQPWVVQGIMTVSEGATPNPGIDVIFFAFLLLYVALTAGLLKMLLRRPPGGGGIEAGQGGERVEP